MVSDRLDASGTELELERRRITDELEALKTFADRVQSIETATESPSRAGCHRVIVDAAGTDGRLDRVRTAYESTVMSVPHYAEDYGDTYRQSLREEFTPDIAVALTDGRAFDDRCKRALLSAIAESRSARESLVAEIDAEKDSITKAAETLSSVGEELDELSTIAFEERSFGALDAYRSRLGVLENKCETVSDRRQRTVFEQRRTRWLPADIPDIAKYFYQDLSIDYPVMATVAELVESLYGLRLRIERTMTFCRA
ncbi:MAG: hypothetical protein V5A36_00320 [Natronomonas sp.]